MAAERDPVGERVAGLGERLEDAVGGDHRAHRRVGGRDALGRRDDVRLVVVLLGAEVGAEAAPAADHLVGDEDDPELVADLAHALEVAVGGREAAARVLHRLEDHARDGLGALEQDALVDRLRRVVDLGPVGVRVRHVGGAREQRLERAPDGGDAGRGQRAHGRAVVGELARDDLVAPGVAGQLVVLAAELERGVDRLGAAGGEEDAVEVAGGELGDARRELDRLRVRVGPVRVEAELLGLVGAGLGDVAAAVADVHAEQGGEAVEIAVAVLVPDVAPVAAGDDRDLVVVVAGHLREVHPQMPLGQVLKARLVLGAAGRDCLILDCRHGSPWSASSTLSTLMRRSVQANASP